MAAPDQTVDVFDETPEVHERNLRIGVRVLGGSTIMFFFAFAFAYFYLRSVDSHGRWNPGDAGAPDGFGAAFTGLFAVGAAAISIAAVGARRRRPWLVMAGVALAALSAAIVLQAVEYLHLDFSPHAGGYSSVFFGWTALLAVFALGAVYWVTVLFAEGASDRRSGPPMVPPSLEEAAFYIRLLALIAVASWVCLYLL